MILIILDQHRSMTLGIINDFVSKEIMMLEPIKDIDSLAEYRKQVKLYPYSSKDIESIAASQRDLNWKLIKELNAIYQSDQLWRNQLSEQEIEQDSSDTLSKYHDQIAAQDSINLSKVTSLIDSKGWLGIEHVGYLGNQTLFLVIQHADLQIQQQYLPMMRKAVSKGKASALNLAYLEDRIAVAKGEKQIYGTQVQRDLETGDYYVPAILDPEQVNTRRNSIGLGSLESYLKRWGIEWNHKVKNGID